ncbi:MAG: DUF4845 domain-containing protein [Salinisphaera sp.]|nr:DUF4845 domain-containing protein [Salinisphaera sp.]MDN5938327.1 DUF4845 domain-containing protein [Salinisphaera sp.]
MIRAARKSAQRGLTFWGWLYVLATLGVMLLVGIKVLPVYLNHYQIQAVLAWAAEQQDLRDAPAGQIQRRIQKRFSTGYVDNVRGRDLHIERVSGGRELRLQYHVKVPLFGAVSLYFEFDDRAFLPLPQG